MQPNPLFAQLDETTRQRLLAQAQAAIRSGIPADQVMRFLDNNAGAIVAKFGPAPTPADTRSTREVAQSVDLPGATDVSEFAAGFVEPSMANILGTAVSPGTGALARNLAGRLGIPLVKRLAVRFAEDPKLTSVLFPTIEREGLTEAFGAGARILEEPTFMSNLARAFGVALPFAAGDSIDALDRNEDESPASAFASSMAVMTAFDLALTTALPKVGHGIAKMFRARMTEEMYRQTPVGGIILDRFDRIKSGEAAREAGRRLWETRAPGEQGMLPGFEDVTRLTPEDAAWKRFGETPSDEPPLGAAPGQRPLPFPPDVPPPSAGAGEGAFVSGPSVHPDAFNATRDKSAPFVLIDSEGNVAPVGKRPARFSFETAEEAVKRARPAGHRVLLPGRRVFDPATGETSEVTVRAIEREQVLHIAGVESLRYDATLDSFLAHQGDINAMPGDLRDELYKILYVPKTADKFSRDLRARSGQSLDAPGGLPSIAEAAATASNRVRTEVPSAAAALDSVADTIAAANPESPVAQTLMGAIRTGPYLAGRGSEVNAMPEAAVIAALKGIGFRFSDIAKMTGAQRRRILLENLAGEPKLHPEPDATQLKLPFPKRPEEPPPTAVGAPTRPPDSPPPSGAPAGAAAIVRMAEDAAAGRSTGPPRGSRSTAIPSEVNADNARLDDIVRQAVERDRVAAAAPRPTPIVASEASAARAAEAALMDRLRRLRYLGHPQTGRPESFGEGAGIARTPEIDATLPVATRARLGESTLGRRVEVLESTGRKTRRGEGISVEPGDDVYIGHEEYFIDPGGNRPDTLAIRLHVVTAHIDSDGRARLVPIRYGTRKQIEKGASGEAKLRVTNEGIAKPLTSPASTADQTRRAVAAWQSKLQSARLSRHSRAIAGLDDPIVVDFMLGQGTDRSLRDALTEATTKVYVGTGEALPERIVAPEGGAAEGMASEAARLFDTQTQHDADTIMRIGTMTDEEIIAAEAQESAPVAALTASLDEAYDGLKRVLHKKADFADSDARTDATVNFIMSARQHLADRGLDLHVRDDAFDAIKAGRPTRTTLGIYDPQSGATIHYSSLDQFIRDAKALNPNDARFREALDMPKGHRDPSLPHGGC